MHAFTHTKPESVGQAGPWQSGYHVTMIDHDKNVGELLDLFTDRNRAGFWRRSCASSEIWISLKRPWGGRRECGPADFD
jgi:hypothetical protein